ncbi:odorant receptor 83a-like isoform X1 [Hylaeus volcanicus]|uniref:odorant receptor 83a-like isoform X1 n=1 Tax=Hylaeus volcanicus TaxID=313075 RepID=UPI0023B80E79|nr:odorant receptor 83a-like isoform X1 [Hylaeus volcanicus]
MQNSKRASTKCLSMVHEYEKYVNLSTQWNRWLLKPMGAWPLLPNISRAEKCFNWQINAVCYGLISFLFIPCGLYVMLEVEDLYSKIKLFGPLIFCVMAYLKYYSLIFHGNDIRECLDRIEWDWKNVKHLEDRDIMVATANFGRRLVKVSTFFMYSGFVFYYIAVPISVGTIAVVDENLTFIPMVFPFSRLLVDTRQSPANEILFTIQMLGGVLIHGIAAAGCSLAAVFAMHACGQMKVLMCLLDNLITGRSDIPKSVDGRIANIVSQHVRILKFLALIEKAMSEISLIEVSGCTLDMCLVGYYIIVEWNSKDMTATVTYTIILASLTFNIFIFCYIGELVAEQCKMVGERSYMIEWHRLPGKKRLSLVLIIAMSNATIKLTAGNLIKLSLDSFSSVIKTSVAFLNMLRTLT